MPPKKRSRPANAAAQAPSPLPPCDGGPEEEKTATNDCEVSAETIAWFVARYDRSFDHRWYTTIEELPPSKRTYNQCSSVFCPNPKDTTSYWFALMRISLIGDDNVKRLSTSKPVATPSSYCRAMGQDWCKGSMMAYAMQWIRMPMEDRQQLLRMTRRALPGFCISLCADASANLVVFYLEQPLTELARRFGYTLCAAVKAVHMLQDTSDPASAISRFIQEAFDDPIRSSQGVGAREPATSP